MKQQPVTGVTRSTRDVTYSLQHRLTWVGDDEGCCWVMSVARRQHGLDDPRFDSLSDAFVINTIAECYHD